MNFYRLTPPKSHDMSLGNAEKSWAAFWDQHRALSMSSGTQAVHRARRKALVNPPEFTSPAEKAKRRERGRAKNARRTARNES